MEQNTVRKFIKMLNLEYPNKFYEKAFINIMTAILEGYHVTMPFKSKQPQNYMRGGKQMDAMSLKNKTIKCIHGMSFVEDPTIG